jgi:hypothetical protein
MNKFDNFITNIVRLISVLFVILYFLDTRKQFAYQPLTFLRVSYWLLGSILYNFGLYFITTKWATKWRVFSTILYIPAFILTPIKVGGDYFWAILILSILIFIKYFPWRKN